MMLVFGCALVRKTELDDGVLVDIVGEGGVWVEDRDGKRTVQPRGGRTLDVVREDV